ncbi:MAG: tetratricopeptide repeat protein [Pseudomonadota bacterium]
MGINYLLSNDHDHAIEEFTKAVQINSNTVETYIALGNLFRSKGEVSRAIRIHNSIMLRPSIDRETKIQALYNLGLDFKKAGFIKRAILSFEEVIDNDSLRLDAYIQLEELYEEINEWEKAYKIQQKISALRKTNDNNVLAHIQTELGKSYFSDNEIKSAKEAFKKAVSLDPNCVDALIHLGDICIFQNDYSEAISTWKRVTKISPPLTHLIYDRLETTYSIQDKTDDFEEFLKKSSKEDNDNYQLHFILAEYLYKRGNIKEAIEELRSVIRINPSSIDARKELGKILIASGNKDELISEYQELLNILDIPEKRFRCQKCGFELENIEWKCPQCLKWDTIIPKELEDR